MAGNPDVFALLEEMLDSGKTPEEVCRDCPELLPEVQQRWQAFRLVDGSLAALFPDPEAPTAPTRPWPYPTPPTCRGSRLRGGGRTRPRRHGRRLQGRHLRLHRPVALKMLLAGALCPAGGAGALPARGGGGGAPAPREHRAGLRRRRPGGPAVLHHGVRRRRQPGPDRLPGMPQPARQAAALVATLAEAVHVAHQSGIVHRDLSRPTSCSPATARPRSPTSAWPGGSEEATGLTLSGVPMGTPSYMAPEQARGDKAGDRAGHRRVRPGSDPVRDAHRAGRRSGRRRRPATLQQVVHDEPVPPSRLNPGVPRDLATICLKCLSKEPQRRYASAAALAEDLRRFLRGEPIAARRLGGWSASPDGRGVTRRRRRCSSSLCCGDHRAWRRGLAHRSADTHRAGGGGGLAGGGPVAAAVGRSPRPAPHWSGPGPGSATAGRSGCTRLWRRPAATTSSWYGSRRSA